MRPSPEMFSPLRTCMCEPCRTLLATRTILGSGGGSGTLSDADRVPDGLCLDERREPARARVGGPVDVAWNVDAFDVVGGRLLQRGARPGVGAGQVDRVDVAVRGQPRRELGNSPGEQVDDAAWQVGG